VLFFFFFLPGYDWLHPTAVECSSTTTLAAVAAVAATVSAVAAAIWWQGTILNAVLEGSYEYSE